MPRVAAILGFSAALLVFCGDLPSVSAKSPMKFDEFGSLNHCDMAARLDNFAIVLQNHPGSDGHIIAYAPPGAGEAILKVIRDYLINTRGLKSKRIKTIYGGRYGDPKKPLVQLWILPRGFTSPPPQEYETDVDTFKGLFADDRARDRVEIQIEDAMGPGIGGTTHAAFVDMLNQQKNAVGYIVVYSGEDTTPGAWRRVADDQLGYLKNFKFDSGRVKVIFGGHRKETRSQLWILPKDAPPPERDAGPELPMAKAIKVQDFYAYDLGDKQNEANVLTRLKEILNAQQNVRAFVVVRLETPTPVEAADETEPASADEPMSEPAEQREHADLTKLVEKWRLELANSHKIGSDRFIVLFTNAPESQASHLRLWIVPKGQPLPDPHEEEEPEPQPE